MYLDQVTDVHVHGLQEIKRRTKTGCLTCRKRRIKVSSVLVLVSSLTAKSRLLLSNELGILGRPGLAGTERSAARRVSSNYMIDLITLSCDSAANMHIPWITGTTCK